MSDPTTLTPPADAPLPWRIEQREAFDADGYSILTIGRGDSMSCARYLVAAANAAPGLVAERDKYRAELERQTAQTFRWHEATDAVVEGIRKDRDTALARVAALEAQLAKQAPVIEAAREMAVASTSTDWTPTSAGWKRATRSVLDAIRTLDKETP